MTNPPTVLHQLTERHGVRKTWLADAVGISVIHLYNVASGTRPLTKELAIRIASAMRLDDVERAALVGSSRPDMRKRQPKARGESTKRAVEQEEEPIID